MRQDESMELLLPPLKRLLKRKRMSTEPQMLLHSDQGTQYSSAGYYTLLKYNVIQSMSRVATPRDNAVIESVFGWFKEFLAAGFLPRTFTSLITTDLLANSITKAPSNLESNRASINLIFSVY